MTLRMKTILGIALIEALVLAVLIVSGLHWLKESNERQLEISSRQLVSVFAKASRDAVLASDLSYLDSFAASIVSEHNLAYIRITDGNGTELAEHGDYRGVEQGVMPSEAQDCVYDVASDIRIGERRFGLVEMGVRVDGLQQLLHYATQSSLILAGIEMILVALFSFALGTYLMTRLDCLRLGVEEVGRCGPGTQIEIQGNDEVSRVSEAFNQMSRSLADAQQSLAQEHQQQLALAAKVKELAQVAEFARDAIVITDAEGRITWVNSAFEQLSGYSLVELLGQTPGRLLQGEQTDPQAVKAIRQSLASNQPIRVEILNYHKCGASYWVELDISPVFNEQGGVERLIAVQRDVTERLGVARQLESALESATKATQAKSEFLANMSHEIRTPMNAVMGISELLLEEIQDARHQTQLRLIHQSADNLVTIINDILDFSKIEAGKLLLQEEPFELQQLLEGALALCAYQAGQKGVHLLLEMPPVLPNRVIGDKGRLNQVLINLLGNAIKFTVSGHVKLSLVEEVCGPRESCFLIRVEDTGIGIPAARLPHIMDKFEQVDNSATRAYQGTGLGLAICKRLVGLFGGQLAVRSCEGKGSCFSVQLTLRHEGERITCSGGEIGGGSAWHNAQVIVVDGYAPRRDVIQNMLRTVGTQVVTAASVEAVQSLPQASVILIGQQELVEHLSWCYRVGGQVPLVVLSHGPVGETQVPVGPWSVINQPVTPAKLAEFICGEPTRPGHPRYEALQALQQPLQGVGLLPVQGRQPEPVKPEALGPMTILLAEDSPINRLLVEKMLARTEVTLVMAENGEQAIELYANTAPDLVLTDISMPLKNGYEVTAAIRAQQACSGAHQCPIIGLSAHAMKEELQQSRDAGMDDYLTKPVRKADLLAMIARWSVAGYSSEGCRAGGDGSRLRRR
ncbi:hybrid sensor histidine kinase/response regulator [Photobacterium atrarenae]|uniref:histidine kinase n=1 Tax=Photobacterium atrarenae TaxID=865757 RepID=A0ABY5GED3_9GAMM|nr:ATP-binding protein [Photobacterium atrarenae]UTV26743.1 ATP-binding protein [Photobacterium atrarenae]